MAKQTLFEKAIALLDGEIAVLMAAKERLINLRSADKTTKTRKPRAVVRAAEDRTA